MTYPRLSRTIMSLAGFSPEPQVLETTTEKKMVVFYIAVTLIYLTPLSLIHGSYDSLFLYFLLSMCNLLTLKTQDPRLPKRFFLLTFFLAACIICQSPENTFNYLGLALYQHHNLLIFARNQSSNSFLNTMVTLIIIFSAQKSLNMLVEDNSILLLLEILNSLQFEWVPLYLFSQLSVMIKDVYSNQNTSKDLERLKTELSLLRSENEELKSNLEKQKLLAAAVSHDIRNHLNIILGYTNMLSEKTVNSDCKEKLNVCKIRAKIIASYTDHFLDEGRIKAGQFESRMLNFSKLIEKIWKVSLIEIKEKKLEGHLDFSSDFPQQLELNKTRITRLLFNLIGNAIKFTTTGSVKVGVSWDDQLSGEDSASSPLVPQRQCKSEGEGDCDGSSQKVLLSYYHSLSDLSSIRKKGTLKIKVTDTGCGISSSALSKIFELFTQADSSVQGKFGGYGLGLYISKQIAQRMGGDIIVESKEGHGTTFCVILPVYGYVKRAFWLNSLKKNDRSDKSYLY